MNSPGPEGETLAWDMMSVPFPTFVAKPKQCLHTGLAPLIYVSKVFDRSSIGAGGGPTAEPKLSTQTCVDQSWMLFHYLQTSAGPQGFI